MNASQGSQDLPRVDAVPAPSPTPGPWTVRTLENFGFNIVHYINGDKFDLARVAKCGEEANARLIAAAPDLLDALKMCVIERGEWLTEARAAIAKATGGEP